MKPHLPVLLRKALLACFAFTFVCSASSSAADLTLGGKDSLTIDFAAADSIPDLAGGTLQLSGDTILHLFNCGEGDGKTYTLLTGVGALLDAEGNPLPLTDENNAASLYFDTSQPGTGFWADGWLQLAPDGSVQLVLHEKEVQDALTITTRQTGNVYYSYCAGISFKNLTTTDSNGGAIYGSRSSTITLSNNGSVEFVGNTASSSGGAIYGVTITLSNNGSVEFVGNTASSSTNHAKGGAISGDMISGVSLTLSNNSSVVFEGNTASSSTNYAWGGAIYGDGDITLSNNGSVVFEGNTASSGSSSAMGAMGGAICGDGDITLSNNGSVVFVGNTASSGSSSAKGGAIYGGSSSTITLSNNGSVVFEGNTTSSGGAIRGHTITLSNNGSVEFVGNTASSTGVARGGAIDVSGESNGLIITGNASGQNEDGSAQQLLFENNHTKRTDGVGSLGAYGGAIDAGSGSTLKINNNGETIFRGNYASSTQSDAWGGAIHKQHGIFSIQNNASVVFEKNYTLQGETLRLQGIYAYDLGGSGDEMVVNFSAPKDGKIEFRDSIHIDVHSNSASAFHLNNWYENDEGAKIAQTGDIIFTGADATAENLKAILAVHGINREATADEIRLSKTYEVWGTMQLHDGRLIVRDGAVIEADGITVYGSASGESTPTLWLDNGELSSYLNSSVRKNAISISGDSALRLSGQNTAMYSTLTLSTGSTLIIDVAATHAATAALTLDNGTLTLGGGITLQLNAAEGLAADGRYMLLSGLSEPTDWASHITVSGGVWSIDNLSWVGDTLYLNYPTLTEATWNNASGDWVWNVDSSVNWEQHELNWAYRNGIGVIFGDEACGTVKLAVNLAPKSVLVNNSIGKDYVFSGTGSLTDSMKLTKEGTGKLTIQTSNSYTGGTEIKGGVLVVDNTKALGTGEVVLNGGTLEIAVTGLANILANTGTSTLKVSNGKTHSLAGTIDNSGELTLEGLFDATALATAIGETHIDATGQEGNSGFLKTAGMEVDIMTGSGTLVNNGTVSISGTMVTLDSTGYGKTGAELQRGTYTIVDGTHSVEAILRKSTTANIILEAGTLTADASTDALTATGGIINMSDAIELGGSICGTELNVSAGKLTATLEGANTLNATGWNISQAITNNGTLTLTGTVDASALATAIGETHIDATGQEGNSGFLKTAGKEVDIMTGSGTLVNNGTVSIDGTTVTLDDKGYGKTGAELQLGTYTIVDGTHSVEAILRKSTTANIILEAGTLTADASTDALTATGGSIEITEAATLGGSIENTAVSTASGSYSAEISAMLKGDTTLEINGGEIIVSGDNSYTGGTTLKNGTVVAETATALGTGGVVLNGGTLEIGATGLDNSICNTGTSTLQTSAGITHVLTGTISNTGTLTLSGSFDASALDYETKGSDERYALDGSVVEADKSGFAVGVTYQVKVIDGGTTINDISTILHDSHAGSNALVLESDGYARANGDGSYSVFYLEGTDSLAVSTIAGVSSQHQETLSKVIMDSGSLTVDQSITVDADGGSIVITKSSELRGTIDDTAVSTGAGDYIGAISAVMGGSSSLAVGGGNITVSGANSYTGGTQVNGGTLVVSSANALGIGSVTLNGGTLEIGGAGINNTISNTGTSILQVVNGVAHVLGNTAITNSGTLTISGSFEASALEYKTETSDQRYALDGSVVSSTQSGFSMGEKYAVQIVNGGLTNGAGATITHTSHQGSNPLVLGEDGWARANGDGSYSVFYLEGDDSLSVSSIAGVSTQNQETLDKVVMDSGELTVDQSVAVLATGGSIVITKAAELGGSINDTAVSTGAGDYTSTISAVMGGNSSLSVDGGEITVSGANSYTGGTTVNGGTLVAGNAQAFGTGDVTVNGATLDLNRFSITNKVLMNGSSTLGNADGASHIVLGSGAAVNFRDGYTLSGGKRLVVEGSASYTGALTLGGGTLELDGLLTVRGDVVFASGATTTLDISGWKGLDDGDVLVDFGSSNSGYADGCLSLDGIAGDWELAFDAASGVLTLVAVKEAPVPEPEFAPELDRNQQIVYDTMKDIMGEGKPDGLLGQLGKEVTDTRDEARLKELLDALGGAEYATLMSSQQDAARGHMRRLRGSMGSGHALAGTKTRAYIEAYTNRSDVDGDASGRGYEMTENGGQFALEFLGVEKVNGGFAVASGRTKLQPDGALSQKSNNTYVDAFLVHRDGGYTGKTSLGVGVHSYNLERNVMGNAVSAQTDGSSVNFMHESAYEVAVDEVNSVQFFGALESSMGKLGAFHEKGAGTASLQVESQDAWMTTLSAGARYHYRFAVLETAPAATLSLQAGLEYKLGDTESEVEMNFSGAGSHRFRQSGSKRDSFGYNVGASLHMPVSARAAIYASGDAVLRGDSREVNANVGIQLAF